MRLLMRLLFGKSRGEVGLLVALVLLGATAAVINSEEFQRYRRMRRM